MVHIETQNVKVLRANQKNAKISSQYNTIKAGILQAPEPWPKTPAALVDTVRLLPLKLHWDLIGSFEGAESRL